MITSYNNRNWLMFCPFRVVVWREYSGFLRWLLSLDFSCCSIARGHSWSTTRRFVNFGRLPSSPIGVTAAASSSV